MERRHISRLALTVTAIVTVFAGGTIGFHHLLHESWHSAFYRAVVTATLTGLDTTPKGAGAEFLTIGLALSGVAIFGYLAAQAVEAVAREVTGHARREKRRRRMIEQLRDHFIICGFGRVGRRAAEEFAASGQAFVVLDFRLPDMNAPAVLAHLAADGGLRAIPVLVLSQADWEEDAAAARDAGARAFQVKPSRVHALRDAVVSFWEEHGHAGPGAAGRG